MMIDAGIILVILSLIYQKGILQLGNYDLKYLIERGNLSKAYVKLLNTDGVATTLRIDMNVGERFIMRSSGHVLIIRVVQNDRTKYTVSWIFPMEIKAMEYNITCSSPCFIIVKLILNGEYAEVMVRRCE